MGNTHRDVPLNVEHAILRGGVQERTVAVDGDVVANIEIPGEDVRIAAVGEWSNSGNTPSQVVRTEGQVDGDVRLRRTVGEVDRLAKGELAVEFWNG